MRKTLKGINAALLSLCVLCGLLLSVTVLPAAATTGDETAALPEAFEADFADLAAQVDPADFTDGMYVSRYNDEAVNNWIDERFDIVATNTVGALRAVERRYLGQTSYAFYSDVVETDALGGESYWAIGQDGYLHYETASVAGTWARKGEQFVVKTANGTPAQLKYFEATVKFTLGDHERGGIIVSFHEDVAGRFIDGENKANSTSNAVMFCTNTGGTGDPANFDVVTTRVKGQTYNGGYPGYDDDWYDGAKNNANKNNGVGYTTVHDTGKFLFGTTRGSNYSTSSLAQLDVLKDEFELKVVVTATEQYAVLTNLTKNVVYQKALDGKTVQFKNITPSYGTLSIGVTNSDRAIKSIEVKELDENGNQVDFGTATADTEDFYFNVDNLLKFNNGTGNSRYADAFEEGTADATNKWWFNITDATAKEESIAEYQYLLRRHFDEYLDATAGKVTKTDFAKVEGAGTDYGKGSQAPNGPAVQDNAGFWQALSNTWLQRPTELVQYKENLRLVSSLVPKNEITGEAYTMTNFEASFRALFEYADSGSIVIGARQQTPGKFTAKNSGNRANTAQALVMITQTGISVAGGSDITDAMYNSIAIPFTDYTPVKNADFTVKVRMVGDDVKLYVQSVWTVTENNTSATKTAVLFDNFAGGKDETTVLDLGGFVEEGYVAFGVGEEKMGINTISLTRLNDAGEPTDIDGPEAFEVDFKELAQVAYADGTYDANGLYTSRYDDKAINDWTNTRFDIYHTNQNSDTVERLYLGQSSYAFFNNTSDQDGWGGAHNWLIDKTGYLRYNVTRRGDQQLRKGEQLVLKTASGAQAQMENFEATVVFNTLADDRGGVVVSFHEPVAGKFAEANGATAATSAVIVGNAGDASSNDGVIVRQSGAAANYNGLNNTTAVRALQAYLTKNLSANTDYKLFVRVLNKKVTVRVTSADGATVHYAGEATLTASYNGTISVGVVNANRAIKSIEVKEMDADGAYVDFGTATTNVKDFKYSFDNVIQVTTGDSTTTKYPNGKTYFHIKEEATNYPEAVAEMQYNLRQRFDEYMDAQSKWTKTDFAVVEGAGTNSGTDNGKDNGGFWQLWEGWIQRKTKGVTWKQNMRLVSSMVPKDEITGEPYKMTNFETSFTVRFEGAMGLHGSIANSDHTQSTIVLGFRQGETGHYVVGENWVRSDQAYLAITQSGITVAGGDNIPKDKTSTENAATHKALYNGDATYSFADFYTPVSNAVFDVRARVVGNEMKLYVHSSWTVTENGTKVTKTAELFNNFEGGKDEAVVLALGNRICEGAVAYGIGEYEGSINDISLTRLDANGNPIDLDAGDDSTATVTNYKAGDGKQAIVVEAEEGFELKAGSLKAIDEDGNVYVPARVGFREDATITDRYEIPTEKPVVLVYEFVKPTLKAPNIGNIGTSINEEVDGLRFVSRFTRVEKDSKEYLVLDGKEYEIADYGMLVAFASVVEANDGVLDIALSEKYGYVKKISIYKETKLYYDLCDAHVDTSVCIIGLDNVTDGKTTDITARPFVTVLVNGVEQTLYADAFTSNYTANV